MQFYAFVFVSFVLFFIFALCNTFFLLVREFTVKGYLKRI